MFVGLAATALIATALLPAQPVAPPLVLSRCPGVAPAASAMAGPAVELAGAIEAVSDGAMWTTWSESQPWPSTEVANTLIRMDPRTGRVLARTPLAVPTNTLVAGGGWLWALSLGSGGVVRLDPRTGGPSASVIGLGDDPYDIAFGDGALWALFDRGRTVRRIDVGTGRVGPAIETGGTGIWLAAGEGALWAPDYPRGALRRIDTRSGAVTVIPLDMEWPGKPVIGLGSVWVPGDGYVVRVDARTLRTRRIAVGGHAAGPVIAAGSVWLAEEGKGVFRIDPRCDHPVGPFVATPGTNSTYLASAGGTVWVSDWSSSLSVPVRLAS
jgi:streptogramin lyase